MLEIRRVLVGQIVEELERLDIPDLRSVLSMVAKIRSNKVPAELKWGDEPMVKMPMMPAADQKPTVDWHEAELQKLDVHIHRPLKDGSVNSVFRPPG